MTRQTNGGTALARRPSEGVTRWDPWTELDQMRQQMDSVFGNVFGLTPLSRFIPSGPGTSYGNFDFSPDVYETNDELVYVFAVPGIEPGALNVEATGNTLTISGERKPLYEGENVRQIRQSFWSAGNGAFQWSTSLPVEIDPNKVQATYRNGLVEIHLAKPESIKPKSVKVEVHQS